MSHIADGEKPSDVTNALLASIKANTGRTFLTSAKELALLKQRLLLVLSNDEIGIKAKAISLTTERPALLQEVKIISDIRPVFGIGKGKSEKIEACSIMHTLVLKSYQDGEYKSQFIALDANDLIALKNVVERASAKETAMESFIAAAKVSRITVK